MASVRKLAFQQTRTSLGNVVELLQVFDDPKALESTNRFPVAYLHMLPDDERSLVGIPGTDEEVFAGVKIVLYGTLTDATLVEDLEDVIDAVITRLKADIPTYRGLDPPVYITDIQVVEGPLVDTQRRLSTAEIDLKFHN